MRKVLLLLILAAAFASCRKLYDPIDHRDQLIGFHLGSDTMNMYVGEMRQIPITTNPSSYSLDSLKWSTSDSTVIAISNAGLLTAKKVGVSTVTVTSLDGTLSVNALVTVKALKPDSLKVGLIAYWPLNGNAVDSSGNGNNGTVFAATPAADRNGKANSAYYFDGLSSYITVNDNPSLRLNNTDFTINMWVDLSSYINASGSALLSKNQGAGQQGWNCSIVGTANQDGASPGNLFYNVSGGSDPFAAGSIPVDTGKWSMLTITYQLSKHKITLYVNTIYDSSVVSIPTPNANSDGKLHIGNNSYLDVPGALAPPYFFNGKINDIRIYNRILSTSDIIELHSLTD